MLDRRDKCKQVEILITIRGLWTTRNKLLFEGQSKRPGNVATFFRSYCLELHIIHDRMKSRLPHVIHYIAPSLPFVKINFDCHFKQEAFTVVSRVIIRDNNGHILGARCKMNCHIASSFAAEAQATIDGLQLVLVFGFRYVILEGDSLSAIKKLKSEKENFSEISALIWDAKQLSRAFSLCQFRFTPRDSNKVAHAMAQEWISPSSEVIWIDGVLESITTLATADRRQIVPP
ncbi:hypothetical protein V6N12_076418 [Hibiscus sabdariffa]|uniref:RNase H type-1 domain-containing protein n=1 Tax=Hibiscus sabdariffa TaxID=183260 RepID=A0ABR2D9Q4_9ROSI